MIKKDFTKCELKKIDMNGTLRDICWLPKDIAIHGNCIKTKQPDGEWSRGWKIIRVFSETKTVKIFDKSEEEKFLKIIVEEDDKD